MIPRVGYHNKLRVYGPGGTEEPPAGVVDASAVEVVDGVWVRGGRPCFLGLPIPHLDLGVYPAIANLYNI